MNSYHNMITLTLGVLSLIGVIILTFMFNNLRKKCIDIEDNNDQIDPCACTISFETERNSAVIH